MKLFKLVVGNADHKSRSENLDSLTEFMKDCRSVIPCITRRNSCTEERYSLVNNNILKENKLGFDVNTC